MGSRRDYRNNYKILPLTTKSWDNANKKIKQYTIIMFTNLVAQ